MSLSWLSKFQIKIWDIFSQLTWQKIFSCHEITHSCMSADLAFFPLPKVANSTPSEVLFGWEGSPSNPTAETLLIVTLNVIDKSKRMNNLSHSVSSHMYLSRTSMCSKLVTACWGNTFSENTLNFLPHNETISSGVSLTTTQHLHQNRSAMLLSLRHYMSHEHLID